MLFLCAKLQAQAYLSNVFLDYVVLEKNNVSWLYDHFFIYGSFFKMF